MKRIYIECDKCHATDDRPLEQATGWADLLYEPLRKNISLCASCNTKFKEWLDNEAVLAFKKK